MAASEEKYGNKRSQASYLVCLLPLLLASFFWFTRPFADALASKTVSLRDLSIPQKLNIELAVKKLDGVVIKPKELFSFNGTVGPRTMRQGYLKAPAYLGPDTPSSPGGGICLVSSCLYQAALESGLTIIERVAHTRTIKSVPPGLDATVWYGKSDLRFENMLDNPVQIHTRYSPNEITVELYGTRNPASSLKIHRFESRRSINELLVEVVKGDGVQDVLVSRDLYHVSQ